MSLFRLLKTRAMSSHKKLMAEEFLDGLCHGEVIQDIQPSTVQHPRDRPRGAGN